MAAIKGFEACIVDEYGQEFPEAIAFIWDDFENLSRRRTGKKIGDEREVTTVSGGLAYSVMYWYDQCRMDQGFKARELRIDDGKGGFTNAIPVDVNHADYANIMNSAIPEDDKTDKVLEEDLKRKFG